MSDLTTWLSKPEAAARLGISERTLDRMGEKGPERRLRPRPGKKPEPVYNPDDVDTISTVSKPAMVIPAGSPLAGHAAAAGIPPHLAMAVSLIEKLAAIVHRPQLEAPRPSHRLWLTIPEASEYSGLSKGYLRRMVRGRVLSAIRDGATKVRRSDLDSLDRADPVSRWLAKSAGGEE